MLLHLILVAWAEWAECTKFPRLFKLNLCRDLYNKTPRRVNSARRFVFKNLVNQLLKPYFKFKLNFYYSHSII